MRRKGFVKKNFSCDQALFNWCCVNEMISVGQWPCYEKIWYLHMHASQEANKYSADAV